MDPVLVSELHRLYSTLRDLNERIAAGQGDETVRDLRADYLRLYQEQRAVAPAVGATAMAGTAAASPTTPLAPAATGAPTAPPLMPLAGTADDRPIVEPIRPPAPPLRPVHPAFSWQAFLAEQAISIMAYLGGFLLLVATLTFEVGAWQVLSNAIKLAVVALVYIIFGGLGVALRRVTRLRTVARAYLGVFALMTPLVALAVYRFELQATGFPASGMLCVAALYAAVVYLALALRTHLITYAYLGWAALLLGALAVVPWIGAPSEWWAGVAGLVALVLLAPRRVARFEVASVLGQPATQVAMVASSGAVLATEVLAVTTWARLGATPSGSSPDRGAVAVAALVLVALAVAWSLTLRSWTTPVPGGLLDTFDLSVAAFAAQAVLSIAVWARANASVTADVLTALALAEMGGAVVIRRVWRAHGIVRRGMEGLALALACVAAAVAQANLGSSWTLVAALTCGLLVTTGIALLERGRWWLLAAGVFLLLDYRTFLGQLLPGNNSAYAAASLFACLAFALWALALFLGSVERGRFFAAPLYVDALGVALYTLVPLTFARDATFQTAILLGFACAAFVGAWRERQPLAGMGPVAFFGILGMLPYVASGGSGLRASALAVAVVIVALAIRRLLGRVWAWGPYVVAVAAIALTAAYAGARGVDTANWAALGLRYQVWLLLLFAVLAGVGALWEGVPWTMIAPMLLLIWALAGADGFWQTVVLTLLTTAAGMALRQWRGRWWNVPLYFAAILGSLLSVLRLETGDVPPVADTQTWVVVLLLAYAVVAFAVAAHERNPVVMIGGAAYTLLAALLIPGPASLVPTLVLTFGLAGLGVLVRWRFGRAWALAFYVDGVLVSLLSLARVVPPSAGWIEALLLIFAAIAYAITVFEREPLGALLTALYAVGAVAAQPDAHALLPLALGLALAGVMAGGVAGIRWSYPFYAASAAAAAATAVLGLASSRFEAVALLALAVVAYIIAWVESRPDVLPLSLVVGALALAPASGALHLTGWQTVLAYAALAWVYTLGRFVWQALPGLRARGGVWWGRRSWWADARLAGAQVHRWAGVVIGSGAVVGALFAPDAFTPHSGAAQVVALSLVSLAGMLALLGRESSVRLALYGAGELVALATIWEVRWLGADNIQAFILVPASYQLLIGVLLPADQRVSAGERLGQAASLVGALLLTLPTLTQSLQTEPTWAYALALAIEALVLAGLGVGMRSRLLVVVGSSFVGLAALRGAVLAIQSGLPVPAVIGVLALLLMGAATWLSLRARREAHRTG